MDQHFQLFIYPWMVDVCEKYLVYSSDLLIVRRMCRDYCFTCQSFCGIENDAGGSVQCAASTVALILAHRKALSCFCSGTGSILLFVCVFAVG